MRDFLLQLVRDKNGDYSLREVVTVLLIVVMLLSWIAQQFLGKAVPEFMFYAFTSLIAVGCFGYSLERRTFNNDTTTNNNPK